MFLKTTMKKMDETTVTSLRSEDPLSILTCGVRTPILSLRHRLAPRKSLVILAPPGLLLRIQRKTKIPSNQENHRREENRAADCHLRAVEPIIRVALLPILDIGLPYTDTEKFIPWPRLHDDPFRTSEDHPRPAQCRLFTSTAVSAAKSTRAKIETKPTWKILELEVRTIHPLPMFSPPQQHQELDPDEYARRS